MVSESSREWVCARSGKSCLDVLHRNRSTSGLFQRSTLGTNGRGERVCASTIGLGLPLRAGKRSSAQLCLGLYVVHGRSIRRRGTGCPQTQKLIGADDQGADHSSQGGSRRFIQVSAQS